jgi:hypothetical protein
MTLVCASDEVHRVIGARHRRGDGAAFDALSVGADLCSRPRPHVRVPTLLAIPVGGCRPWYEEKGARTESGEKGVAEKGGVTRRAPC